MGLSHSDWKQKWMKVGYRAARQGFAVSTVKVGDAEIDRVIEKGYKKHARAIPRIERSDYARSA